MVAYKGKLYKTLDVHNPRVSCTLNATPVHSPCFHQDKSRAGCQNASLLVPAGWQLAADNADSQQVALASSSLKARV